MPLTADGFTPLSTTEIITTIEAAEQTSIAPDLNTSPTEPVGQINGIMADQAAQAQELLAEVCSMLARSKAEGIFLDNVGELSGTGRLQPKKSSVLVTVNLNSGVTLSPGAVLAVDGEPSNRWVLRDQAGPLLSGGNLSGCVFESQDEGIFFAAAHTLTIIITPVSGWNSGTNPADSVDGRDLETDAAYRVRQVEELTLGGSSTVDAIRADLLALAGIEEAFVFENTTMTTDANGLPPKSIRAVVFDGLSPATEDGDIAQVIWDNRAGGIETSGAVTGSCFDSRGNVQTQKFSRAAVKTLYLTYALITNGLFPSDGQQQVKDYVAKTGKALLTLGQDVLRADFLGMPRMSGIPGIVNVSNLKLGFSSSPSGTTDLAVTDFEIAALDTTRIAFEI